MVFYANYARIRALFWKKLHSWHTFYTVVMVATNLNSAFDKYECADVEIVHVDGSGGGLHVPPSKQDHCPVSHPLLPYRHPELRKFPISATSDKS